LAMVTFVCGVLLSDFVFVVGMKGTFALGTLGGWPPLEVGHP
jgi:hypothetical protein